MPSRDARAQPYGELATSPLPVERLATLAIMRKGAASFAAIASATACVLAACSLTADLGGLSGAKDDVDASDPVDGAKTDGAPPTKDDAATVSYAATVLEDGPIGYWRLGGTVVAQGAGDELHRSVGTYEGPVQLGVPGAIVGDTNAAVAFDGISSLIDFGQAFEFRGRAPFTLEAWASPKPLNDGKGHRIVGRRSSDITGYRLLIDADGTTKLERWANNTVTAAVAPALVAGRYSHVVATYDGDTSRIYIDGVLAATAADMVAIPPVAIPFVVGASSTKAFDFFYGSIDEVAVYDTALSGDRIAAHYHAAGR
ncbi:MAG: Autotransporter adhesin [Labilithrix sp.]|nr:Autotransporter adhesin [Labilithrix sp.]